MRDDLGEHLFTFAVISDSHVNEGEDKSASPYESNKLANGRFRYVVACLNRLRPAFTVHLGDMANPLPELATYPKAVANFKQIAAGLDSPLHLVAGNHCVGDKPTGWVPVPRVCEESLAQHEELFGRHYYGFDFGSCHFAVLNSLLVNSQTVREREQQRWLEDDLARARGEGKRLFVMMHYPLYVAAADEPGSYDNVDEPGRTWLLGLLERHGVEAAFSGHVHNYFYNRHGETHMYTLPASSFVRQDYGELYSVAPRDQEGGRCDTAKLGFALVRVYERGHVHHLVRTEGRGLAPGESLPAAERLETVRPREAVPAPVGAEMRENWLSRMTFMTNNSVSPFTRRSARNDWPLAALEEMGISRVRLFLQELDKSDVVERMADLRALGYEFTVYSYGIPSPLEYDLVREHHALLAGWEHIMGLDQIESVASGMDKLTVDMPDGHVLPSYLSEVHDVQRGQIDDANVRHVANYGFQVTEHEHVARLLESKPISETFRGLVFRLRRRGEARLEPWRAIREISGMGRESGMRHQVHVLFSGNVTAERFVDDLYSANRVAESTLAAVVAGNVDVWFDTFEDSDRGYFVRNGLVDRRYDPRPAAKVQGWLSSVLATLGPAEEGFEEILSHGRLLTALFEDRFAVLVLPNRQCWLEEIATPWQTRCRKLTSVDLGSGELSDVRVASSGSSLQLEEALDVARPRLLIGES